MTKDVKQTIINALHQYRCDNLERAKAAFRGRTPEQMQERWGQSSETCQQILDGYQQHVDRVNIARRAIDDLPITALADREPPRP